MINKHFKFVVLKRVKDKELFLQDQKNDHFDFELCV